MIPKEVFSESVIHFLEPIRAHLEDESVSEVMINGPHKIYVERRGQLVLTNTKFSSPEALLSALRNIAQFVGRPLDEEHPILEGHLPDGSRVEALLPPVAPDGPSVAIRRFSKSKLTIGRLVEVGALPEDAATLLKALVICQQNIIVAGGTGTGKTSMLNALSSFIPKGDRIVVIEDARELQLQHDHVVQLETRAPDPRGKGAVSIRDLFKATLRLRPDRIVIGEIRSGEALDLIQAMTSGHGGCLSTVHASYPRDAMSRLETMALMADVELPLLALRSQLGSGIDIIVQVTRLKDGSRKVSHISEVRGTDEKGEFKICHLFEGKYGSDGAYRLAPSGALPRCEPLMVATGVALPPSMLAAASEALRRQV